MAGRKKAVRATQLGLFPGCEQDYHVTARGALVPIRPVLERQTPTQKLRATREGPAAFTFEAMQKRGIK